MLVRALRKQGTYLNEKSGLISVRYLIGSVSVRHTVHIDTLPEIPGLALYKDGHAGYCIGNVYAVE